MIDDSKSKKLIVTHHRMDDISHIDGNETVIQFHFHVFNSTPASKLISSLYNAYP
ncbi:MAG TPA: hypothetical protein PLF86_03440 [Candidatus Moranbacteria bacterium]|nr:hypothetical protein [Candidatus Moranbacteria bacterium]